MNTPSHIARTKRGQVNFEDWELRVLLAVNGKGVSASRVAAFFGKSETSIRKKATDQGVSLNTKGKKQ